MQCSPLSKPRLTELRHYTQIDSHRADNMLAIYNLGLSGSNRGDRFGQYIAVLFRSSSQPGLQMQNRMILKIVSRDEWAVATEAGTFRGAEIDLQDGYIHFSSVDQAAETAAKHFAGRDDLLLVAVNEKKLGNSIRWEASRGGQLFPHLYAELKVDLVEQVWELPLGKDGFHRFPDFD